MKTLTTESWIRLTELLRQEPINLVSGTEPISFKSTPGISIDYKPTVEKVNDACRFFVLHYKWPLMADPYQKALLASRSLLALHLIESMVPETRLPRLLTDPAPSTIALSANESFVLCWLLLCAWKEDSFKLLNEFEIIIDQVLHQQTTVALNGQFAGPQPVNSIFVRYS